MKQLESKGSTIIVLSDAVAPSTVKLALKEGFKEYECDLLANGIG